MNYEEIINIKVLGGTDIDVAVTEAIDLAKKRNGEVSFKFNSIPITIDRWANPKEIVEFFHNEMNKIREAKRKATAIEEVGLFRLTKNKNYCHLSGLQTKLTVLIKAVDQEIKEFETNSDYDGDRTKYIYDDNPLDVKIRRVG